MLLYYLIIMNVIALFMYGIDKRKAIKGKWRISEIALLLVGLLGGSIGSIIGMYMFRHKTKHWKFIILVPMFLILHILLFIKFCI